MADVMTDDKMLWGKVLTEIETNVSKANFSTWFRDTEIARLEDGIVYVTVQNAFVRDWLANKYHKVILKILREASGQVRGLDYIVAKLDHKKSDAKQQVKSSSPANPSQAATLPLSEHYIDRESNLNPRYTFESFVVGPFNELAYTASQAVIKGIGAIYNPLFVYGNTGHGKTHLIQAVGNYIRDTNPAKKVFYLTSERFYLDFFNAMQANQIPVFKERYRKYDVLIMDDIQYLGSKPSTQDELFHLFNNLYDAGKQIVFSSDKHPNYIPELEARLKSRFAAGMIVDIPPPDLDSRLAIIRAKSNRLGIVLSEEVANFLAGAIEGNVREIEGVINTIVCQTQVKNKNLNLQEIRSMIKLNIKPRKSSSVKDVVKAVATYYDINEASIFEKTRRKEVVRPRQIAMYVLREDCNISFPLIGEKIGGRDHTTVLHSYEKIKNELKTDTSLEQDLVQIRAML
jgi:chromosomal replication initiator protein